MRTFLLGVLILLAPACARSRCCPSPSTGCGGALGSACGAPTIASTNARAGRWVEIAPEASSAAMPDPTAAPLRRRLYDGTTGDIIDLRALVAGTGDADVVAFGELHGHPDGARLQLDLLQALAAQERPLVLAMEFFERDTQLSLDAYLAGEIDQAALIKQGRQAAAFERTHGPLLALCKARGFPVVAANAPRHLVTAYRKGSLDYPEYLASLTGEERHWLPATTSTPEDAYYARFVDLMGEVRGRAFFRAQALWDDAMAESVARARAQYPGHRVLLIVGVFHVSHGLGTLTKLADRRPNDTVSTLAMTASGKAELPLGEDNRGLAPFVAVVRSPAALRAAAAAKAQPVEE